MNRYSFSRLSCVFPEADLLFMKNLSVELCVYSVELCEINCYTEFHREYTEFHGERYISLLT